MEAVSEAPTNQPLVQCLVGPVLETSKNIDLLFVKERRVIMLWKVVFVIFAIYLHCCNASKLNVPKLLLPYYSQAPTNFTLEASEGCFTWYDLDCHNIAQKFQCPVKCPYRIRVDRHIFLYVFQRPGVASRPPLPAYCALGRVGGGRRL